MGKVHLEMDNDQDESAADRMLEESGQLEESLMETVDMGGRLHSGTGSGESGDNVLDFIQMSGLTRNPDAEPPTPEAVAVGSEAQRDSLSFYETGVGDVDAQMDPTAPTFPELDAMAVPDSEIQLPSESYSSDSVTGLKEIIAELTGDEGMVEGTVEPSEQGHVDSSVGLTESVPVVAVDLESSIQEDAGFADDSVSDVRGAEGDSVSEVRRSALEGIGVDVDVSEAVDVPMSTDNRINIDLDALNAKAGIVESAKMLDEAEDIDYMARTARRRQKRQRRHQIRWMIRATVAVVVGIGVYFAAQYLLNRTESAGEAYRSASIALDEGRYAEASKQFLSFTRRFPGDIMRSDAMFMGGYALQLTPPASRENAEQAYSEALILLEQFVAENPSHMKVARAETLIGVLHYRMDSHLEAISILGDPDRRLRDPGAYLTALRTLGRSYAALSQTENAHSAFMRAASLQENIAPDEDYVELGSLYRSLSERETSEELKAKYLASAVEQWDFALRVPGLLKSRKEDIALLRDVVVERLESGNLSSPEREEPRPRTSLTTRNISRGNDQGEGEGSSVAPQ